MIHWLGTRHISGKPKLFTANSAIIYVWQCGESISVSFSCGLSVCGVQSCWLDVFKQLWAVLCNEARKVPGESFALLRAAAP